MKKLTGFEKYLIEEGLKLVAEKMKVEITTAESKGKTALFTAGFVDMTVDETLSKLEKLTLKNAFGA
jgi:hypothetical protein